MDLAPKVAGAGVVGVADGSVFFQQTASDRRHLWAADRQQEQKKQWCEMVKLC